MIEYLKEVKNINVSLDPGKIWDSLNNLSFPVAAVAIGLLVLLAIQGYKIFKSLIHVGAAVGFAYVGHLYLAPKVVGYITPHIPESWGIDFGVVIALLCAIFALLVVHLRYDFAIFCCGGLTGYLAGFYFAAPKLAAYFDKITFLGHIYAKYGVAVLCALMAAILFLILFKNIYIVVSSIGCMSLAGYLLYKEVTPDQSNLVAFGFIALGVIIGVFMMVHQFEEEGKSHEYDFKL